MSFNLFDHSKCFPKLEYLPMEKTDRNKKIYSRVVLPGIKGRIKAFDENLNNTFDTKARDFLKNKLNENVIDNPDKYGEDMIVVNEEIPFKYIELQVYGKWKEGFPYGKPFIYERKMRFCENTLFICFNYDLTKILMFSKSSIDTNKYRAEKYSREYIHYIPWNKVFQINAEIFSLKILKECFCLEE